MKRYLYVYFNTVGAFFMPPWPCEAKPEELPEVVNMQFAAMTNEHLKSLSEDDIYFVGEFDTTTGHLLTLDKPQFVMHCAQACCYYLAMRKEEAYNGTEEKGSTGKCEGENSSQN